MTEATMDISRGKAARGGRILALDVLRGITIAGMILVNNPGSWEHIYAPLRHAAWNGLTPTDLVFPFFMFIMGISTYISLRKYSFMLSKVAVRKVVQRTVVIFLIGIAIDWFLRFCYYWPGPEGMGFGECLWDAACTFDTVRIPGVMQRLAVCYGITAFIALIVKHRYIPWIIVGLLAGYFLLLMGGNGFAYDETNLLSIVDRAVFTSAHMYKDNGIDPEGLLSTIPSVAHVLLGFYVGRMMLAGGGKEPQDRETLLRSHLIKLFLLGTVLAFSGWLLSYGCPLNKKIWSPTFVLVTCGLASSLLALLIWLIDVKGYKRWSRFFEAFGVNPLFMYVLGDLLGILFGCIRFPWGESSISLYGFLYDVCLRPWLGNTGGSLAYALLFVLVNWCIGYQLYKKKIYIKI